MEVNGECGCGQLTYRAEVDPGRVIVCHCRDCQTQSGSAFRIVVPAKDGSFEVLSGEIKSFEKVADSGTLRSRAFCPECGTQIYAKTIGEGMAFMGLRVGALAQRDELKPAFQVWTRSAQGWLGELHAVPSYEVQPTAEEMARLGRE